MANNGSVDTNIATVDITISPVSFINNTTGKSYSDFQAVLDDAIPGDSILCMPGTSIAGSYQITIENLNLQLNDCKFTGDLPALIINADDITVLGPGLFDGWTGSANNASPAIVVKAGADNFILENVEIKRWSDGIHVEGAVESLKIARNWIHSNTMTACRWTRR